MFSCGRHKTRHSERARNNADLFHELPIHEAVIVRIRDIALVMGKFEYVSKTGVVVTVLANGMVHRNIGQLILAIIDTSNAPKPLPSLSVRTSLRAIGKRQARVTGILEPIRLGQEELPSVEITIVFF